MSQRTTIIILAVVLVAAALAVRIGCSASKEVITEIQPGSATSDVMRAHQEMMNRSRGNSAPQPAQTSQ